MKLKPILLAALAGVALLAGNGCVGTVDGHMKPGVPFSRDKITSRYERSYSQVASAAKTVLTQNGVLIGDDTIKRTVSAKVNKRTVWVKIDELEPNLSQVTVQVRTKAGMADVELASEIDKQIALQLATSPR
jgi:hypothetical protein